MLQKLFLSAFLISAIVHPVQARAESEGTFVSAKSFIELIVVPPYVEHDWSNPRKLFWSQLDNIANVLMSLHFSAHKSAYGHAMIHLKCGDDADEWSGYTGDRKGEGGRLVLHDKGGLGALLHQYTDAEVQSTPTVLKFIERAARIEKAPPHFLKIPVTSAQCEAMKCHLHAFQNAKNTTYGFSARPRQYEGAGCTSYAASFLQVAGAMDPAFSSWGMNLEISSQLVGTNTLQADHGFFPIDENQPKTVGIRKVIQKINGASSWTREGYPNYSLHIFDPGLMAKFIEEATICAFNRSRCASAELKSWVEARGAVPVRNPNGPSVELTRPFITTEDTGSVACSLPAES